MKPLYFAMTIALSLIVVSCDNNCVQPTTPPTPRYGDIPTSAQWAEAFYNMMGNATQDYSDNQTYCQNLTVNKNLAWGGADSTIILLNGQKIFSWVGGTHISVGGVGATANKCVLLITGFDPGIGYLNNSLLMVDGKNIPAPTTTANGYGMNFFDVRNYVNNWIIIKGVTGHIRAGNQQYYWMIYNIQTGELRDLGAYGPYGK